MHSGHVSEVLDDEFVSCPLSEISLDIIYNYDFLGEKLYIQV